MSHIDVTFEVVTPAYAGTADITQTEGLRPPTLKALLRFWWRTLKAGVSPDDLFNEEEKIFGSTSKGQGLRVVPTGQQFSTEPEQYTFHDVPFYYLAYGAYTHRDEVRRQDLARLRVVPGGTFSFRLWPGGSCTKRQWAEVNAAIWLLSAFGGFGSRSRRAFGSTQVTTQPFCNLAQATDSDDVKRMLESTMRSLPYSVSPRPAWSAAQHTAFTADSKLFVGPGQDTWDNAVKSVGMVYYDLRRLWGAEYNHAARGKPVGDDFLLMNGYRSAATAGSPATQGAGLGLPHNYQFSGGGNRKVNLEAVDAQQAKVRRASSLFMKVLKLRNGQYVPLALWLPSTYLPSSHSVVLTGAGANVRLATPDPTVSAAPLLARSTAVPGDAGGVPSTRTFLGYPGRPGWQEVPL